MRRAQINAFHRPRLALLVLALGAGACASSDPTRRPPAAPPDAAEPASAAPRAQTASQPPGSTAAAPPHVQPAPDRAGQPQPPAAQPAPDEPDPYAIPYLRILELRAPAERPRVDARLAGRRELLLDTSNVQRMRLTRDHLAIPRHLAVVLRLDGQNLEWSANHTAIELERDRNGFWNVIGREPSSP